MRHQSLDPLQPDYAPLDLPPGFPVSEVFHVQRSNVAPIAPHVHNCLEIGYCYSGAGIFVVADKVFSFRAGDAVVINRYEGHIMTSNGSDQWTTWDFVNLDPTGLLANQTNDGAHYLQTDRLWGTQFANLLDGQLHDELCRTIRQIIGELNAQPDDYEAHVRAMVWSLMVRLHRCSALREVDETSRQRTQFQHITPALELIAHNFHRSLCLDELAASCHTSVPTLRRLFYNAVDCSPMQFLQRIRLKAAANLLINTAKPVIEVALQCGFPTVSNFNRQFRDAYQTTPRDFRQQNAMCDSASNKRGVRVSEANSC